jgi:hypothetical protein
LFGHANRPPHQQANQAAARTGRMIENKNSSIEERLRRSKFDAAMQQ